MSSRFMNVDLVTNSGDTPNDRLAVLLGHLCSELDSGPDTFNINHARDLAHQAKNVIDGYDDYVVKHTSRHPPILDEMLKNGFEHDWEKVFEEGKTKFRLLPDMTAGGYEAVVLQHLARMSKAATILEIGMFTGTTTVSLALVPRVEKVVALELEGYLEEHNRPYFDRAGVSDKIDVRIGDALQSLDQLVRENACFDMVFLDADKPSYAKYFEKIINSSPSLLAKGGCIVADNVAWRGQLWLPTARTQ
ncbi:hypothetical protein NLI96_g1752 [Meripilus lineatus]|uniref:O-methyltransferase n=1 Tax=Meripilus lineatus TaxID=2056292 RepID=A0AAD5YI27_9APHY|nr:hypothetical protein NLI96_g1752 [Physisporinus lineatus]